jgi:catechol 2,3-dioxygenase-like lactoylglutathione lyase family enzyme
MHPDQMPDPTFATPPPIAGVDHLHVYVADRPAATRWYARVLGLKPVPDLSGWAAGGGPLVVASQDRSLQIALFERPRQPCRSTIALGVAAPDFEPWRAHLLACLGKAPHFEDHGQAWSLYFDDPDGNPYEITCGDVPGLRASAP